MIAAGAGAAAGIFAGLLSAWMLQKSASAIADPDRRTGALVLGFAFARLGVASATAVALSEGLVAACLAGAFAWWVTRTVVVVRMAVAGQKVGQG